MSEDRTTVPSPEGTLDASDRGETTLCLGHAQVGSRPEGESRSPDDTQTQSIEDLVSPSLDSANACLIVLCGYQPGRVFDLTPGQFVLGRSPDVDIPIDDEGASRRHASIHSSPLGFVLKDLGSRNGLRVNGQRVGRHLLREGDRVQVGASTVLKFSYQDELEKGLRRRLYDSATRDGLTGLRDKRYFLEGLAAAFAHASRKGRPLSVLMLDLDGFKKLNDREGHLVGDHVLRHAAALIQKEVRTEDLLSRFGGDEFVLMMVETGPEPARLVAERIRTRLEARVFEPEGRAVRLTASVGGATFQDGSFSTAGALLAGADAALYDAEHAGRNRTAMRLGSAPSEAEPPNAGQRS